MMKNSFISFIGFCTVVLWTCGVDVVQGITGKTYDLCKDSYLRFSDVGDSGVIVFDKTSTEPLATNPCIIRIETCSSCQISVQLNRTTNVNFICEGDEKSNRKCLPNCDYLYMFDTYYMNTTLQFYGSWYDFQGPFRSESSNIFIGLCHGNSDNYYISLSFQVLPKLKEISGAPSYRASGPIMSPFFPMDYSQNHETYEYNFTNQLSSGFVKLIFDDWHLASTSGFYFEDSNIVGLVGGESKRPVVISNKNNMLVKFHTGKSHSPTITKSFIGFKATYTFISGKQYEYIPRTTCKDAGYIFNSYGGAVDFNPEDHSRQLYDCIWVLQKQAGFTGIYLRVVKFINPGFHFRGENRLVVKSGLSSDGYIVTEIDQMDNVENGVPYKDRQGFYMRLNGSFTSSDRLKFVYASYKSVFECTGDLFQCGGGSCIHPSLKCDGFDHCGDNSDETRCGDDDTGHWDKSYQYTITIGVIIPMVISVFLIMVICLLFVMIRRCRRARMQAAGSVERLRTLSEDVTRTRGRRRRRHRHNMFGERDQPPTYDEAMQNPPGWYLNVAFSNPVDPTLPQPPSYSEAVGQEGAVSTRPRSGSPSSLDSSQSELTVCSHNQSVSSSSSDEGDTWGDYEENTDGRRARRSRHVSSSDSENGTVSNQADPVSQPTRVQNVSTRSDSQEQLRASPSADRSDIESDKEQKLTGPNKLEICDEHAKSGTDKKDLKKVDRPTEFVIPETDKVDNEARDYQSYASRIVQSVLGTRPNVDTNRGDEPSPNHSRQRSMSSESEAIIEESKRKRKKKTRKGRKGKLEEIHPRECLEEISAASNMELVPYGSFGASNYADGGVHEERNKPADASDDVRDFADNALAVKEGDNITKKSADYELVVNVDNDDVMLVYDTHFCDIPQNQTRSVPEQMHMASVPMTTTEQNGYTSDSNHAAHSVHPTTNIERSHNDKHKATVENCSNIEGNTNRWNNSDGLATDSDCPASHVDVQYISFTEDLGDDIYV